MSVSRPLCFVSLSGETCLNCNISTLNDDNRPPFRHKQFAFLSSSFYTAVKYFWSWLIFSFWGLLFRNKAAYLNLKHDIQAPIILVTPYQIWSRSVSNLEKPVSIVILINSVKFPSTHSGREPIVSEVMSSAELETLTWTFSHATLIFIGKSVPIILVIPYQIWSRSVPNLEKPLSIVLPWLTAK